MKVKRTHIGEDSFSDEALENLSPLGLMIPESVLEKATRIVVWGQSTNFKTKKIMPWTPMMEFQITEQDRKLFNAMKSALVGIYISCEFDPEEGTIHFGLCS